MKRTGLAKGEERESAGAAVPQEEPSTTRTVLEHISIHGITVKGELEEPIHLHSWGETATVRKKHAEKRGPGDIVREEARPEIRR